MKSFTYLTILLAFGFFLATPVWAHSLKTNGTISTLLHAEPGDSPVAGKKGSIYLFFTDNLNQFQPTKCNCHITIKNADGVVVDRALFSNLSDQPNGVNVNVPVTFPKIGAYDVRLVGTPKVPGAFVPFDFNYVQRVEHQELSLNLVIVAAIIGGVIAVLLLWYLVGSRVGRSGVATIK